MASSVQVSDSRVYRRRAPWRSAPVYRRRLWRSAAPRLATRWSRIDAEFLPYLQTLQNAFDKLQPDHLPPETASYFAEILKQRRAYIERILAETPPPCDENTATDLGHAGNQVTVPTDGCVKVQDYPRG